MVKAGTVLNFFREGVEGGWAPPGLNRFKEYSAIRKEENDYISCVLQSKDGKNGTYLKKKSESWSDSKNDSKGEVADQCTSKLSLQKKKKPRVDWTYYFWRMKSMVHSSDWLCFFSVNLNLSMYIKKKTLLSNNFWWYTVNLLESPCVYAKKGKPLMGYFTVYHSKAVHN